MTIKIASDLAYLANQGLQAFWRGVECLAAKADEGLADIGTDTDDTAEMDTVIRAVETNLTERGIVAPGGITSPFGPIAAGLVTPEVTDHTGEGDGVVIPLKSIASEPLPGEDDYLGEPATPFENALQTVIVLYGVKDLELVDYLHQCINAWGRASS